MTLSIVLFATLVALNGLDIYTTIWILGCGGRETNPIMDWMMRRFGINTALYVSKTAVLGGLGLTVWLHGGQMAVNIVLAGLVAVYTWVVLKNFGQMK